MENAKLFIYPSQAKEGETFGLAVLEAMSCGCVPIVSDTTLFYGFYNFWKEGFCVGKKSQITKIYSLLETNTNFTDKKIKYKQDG